MVLPNEATSKSPKMSKSCWVGSGGEEVLSSSSCCVFTSTAVEEEVDDVVGLEGDVAKPDMGWGLV